MIKIKGIKKLEKIEMAEVRGGLCWYNGPTGMLLVCDTFQIVCGDAGFAPENQETRLEYEIN